MNEEELDSCQSGCGCRLPVGIGLRIFEDLVKKGVEIAGPSLLLGKQLLDRGYDSRDVDLVIELYQCAIGLHETLLPGDTEANDIQIVFDQEAVPGQEFMRFFYIDGEPQYVFRTRNIAKAFDVYRMLMRARYGRISDEAIKIACVSGMVRNYLVCRQLVPPFIHGDWKWAASDELREAQLFAEKRFGRSMRTALKISEDEFGRVFDGMVIEHYVAIMFDPRIDGIQNTDVLAAIMRINAPDRSGTPFN